MKRFVLVKQHDETDCGAACLATVAKYYGKKVSISRIRYYAGTDVKGTSGLGIVKGAEYLGFSCRGMISEKKTISDSVPYPVIAHVKKDVLDHYVVVYGKKRGKIIVADPDDGISLVAEEEFKKIWTGVFFLIVREQRFERTKETKGLFERFLYLLKPHKKILVECFLSGILLSLLGAAGAFYFRFLIDDVLYSSLKNTLLFCSLAYLAVIVFQTLTEFARNQLMNYMGNKIDLALMCDYFRHILRLPMHFFTSRKTGEIISRIGDTQTIRYTISSTTLSVIIDSCMLVLGGAFLFAFGSSLLWIAMIPVFVSAVLVWIFYKPFERMIKKQAFMEAEKQSALVESVNGISTIKALSSEEKAFNRAEGRIVNCCRQSISLGVMSNSLNSLQRFVSSFGTLLLYWVGSLKILEGSMSLGQLISFVTLSGYFLGPLSRLLTLQQALQEAAVASDRLSEILDMKEESDDERTEEGKKIVSNGKLKGKIAVKGLTFSYGTRGAALKNINFSIQPGQKVAFVGTSGSGKTTMTKLLMKFYRAEKGSITVDGMNISDIDTEFYRDSIGYVPQEVLLFSGTVAENILWGTEGLGMKDVVWAAQAAQASSFIDKMPERYATKVGERGATLSGGERQRISLARVLLRKPSILILDEATSSLDSLSERAIMDTINSSGRGCTMIMVAHRLSTIKNCDRIFVFDKGEIVESGTHFELLAKKKKYYEMWNAQHEDSVYEDLSCENAAGNGSRLNRTFCRKSSCGNLTYGKSSCLKKDLKKERTDYEKPKILIQKNKNVRNGNEKNNRLSRRSIV